jgi:hypothetical protein
MPRRAAVPDEQLPALRTAYEVDRLSVDQVGERFALPYAKAYRALVRAGTTFRRGPRRVAEPSRLRRFERWTDEIGAPRPLAADNASVVQGRTIYRHRVTPAVRPDRILKSGMNNPKIGAVVVKGPWRGMPIYTLTLEERRTCPTSCHHWRSCYGNSMTWSERIEHGPDLERRLEHELWLLDQRHPGGFLVRLHVLGDFYDTGYVLRWFDWLQRYPALHVFGYTARRPDEEIGFVLRQLVERHWPRFAVRISTDARTPAPGWPRAVTVAAGPDRRTIGDAVVCPAQTGRTNCCATCGLCWSTRRDIAFLLH